MIEDENPRLLRSTGEMGGKRGLSPVFGKKLSITFLFVAWLVFGQLMMLAITTLGGLSGLTELYDAISKLIPALESMNSAKYFDAVMARQQAVLMYLAMPLLGGLLFFSDVSGQCDGVLKKGKRNSIAVMAVSIVIGALPLFFGLAPSRAWALLRETQIGFAFLSALVSFGSVYFFRLAFFLFSACAKAQ